MLPRSSVQQILIIYVVELRGVAYLAKDNTEFT